MQCKRLKGQNVGMMLCCKHMNIRCQGWAGRNIICIHYAHMGDGVSGHWLVRMEWRPAGCSVCLPLLISPCTMKSRSSLLAPAHPGGPWKRAVKRLWCGGHYAYMHTLYAFVYNRNYMQDMYISIFVGENFKLALKHSMLLCFKTEKNTHHTDGFQL